MAARLTAEQIAIIRRWAERNPYINGVRLFGSRTQDAPANKDDVDLAVTIAGGRANTPDGIYTRFGDLWQRELGQLLGISVSLHGYPPKDPHMKARADRNAVILWRSDDTSDMHVPEDDESQ